MSRRSSAGDLVPRDISEILAREGRAQRGQKKPGGSLGQAFSWLKGSRKKKTVSNGQNRTGIGSGATEGIGTKLGHQNHDPAKAGPKGQDDQKRLTVHYTASQHYQENVFIEGSRPQYLEDLHTEAQEGLKILQQEEHNNGVEVQDDQSYDSTALLRPEQDACSKDRDGSAESGSTTGNNVPTPASAVSAVSTRPVLTRQGSTFKPLNPVKRLDKGRKRSRRTTIMGIPQQVQRELALHRGYQQGESNQIPNGNRQVSDSQSSVIVIPTIDGETPITNHEGARVHLPGLEASRDELLLHHHLQSVYRDDQGYTHHRLGSRLSPSSIRRPKSLSVPGMTSSAGLSYLQEPQGPVMSISPQATYLSKIIPNAILPASVDVIQIDRRNSRNHGNQGGRVRTVSKSSLASVESSASPASSRRSGGDGCYGDDSQDDPTATPSAASGSNWSQSQSSETIMSNSSTISSSKGSAGIGNPQTVSLAGQERWPRQPRDKDGVSLQGSASWVSSTSSKGGSPPTGQGSEPGSVSTGEMSEARGESIRNSRAFSRSLSIMKTKLPPAPPRRTYSLHQEKMMRKRSKELVDIKDLSDSVVGEVEAGGDGSLAADETGLITKDPVPISATSSPLSPTQAPLDGGPPEHQTGSSNSSPQKALSEGGIFERTMSPSSGYSSQSGTPTLSPKGIYPTSSSPAKQKKKPVKPERSGSRASSSAASVSSSLTSLSSSTSEPVNKEALANSPSLPQQSSPSAVAATSKKAVAMDPSPATLAIRELFNIPPPPKVKAPSPPPPETWAHNSRTFELLCGPSPKLNRLAQLQKQQQQQQKEAPTVQKKEPLTEAEGSAEKQPTVEEVVLSESKERDNTEPMLEKVPECVSQELESMESLTKELVSPAVTEREEASVEVQRQEQSDIVQVKEDESQESVANLPKKEPPPVMKKSTPMSHRKQVEKADVCQHHTKIDGVTIEDTVNLPTEKDNAPSQTEVKVLADKIDGQVATEKTSEESNTKPLASMQALPGNPPKVDRISPSPSPPPAHQPPPPPTKKTPPSSVSTLPPEEEEGGEEEGHIVESCWPPPPPPLEDPAESVFDGPDEMDFPPPPPPFMTDNLPDVVESCTIVTDVQDISTVALEETGVAMNGEGEDLPTITAETVLEEARPEEVTLETNPKPAEAILEVPEPAVLQVTSEDTTAVTSVQTNEKQTGVTQEPVTMQEATTQSILYSQLEEVPPLPEEIPPPPLVAPPPPPMTSSEMPPSSAPLALPISVPLPPPLPFEDQVTSGPPVSAPFSLPDVPLPPPLPAENQATVNFKRHPSLVNREPRSKELLTRNKSGPIPKEDANIPLVTPSLLQMVRLRSVNVGEDQVKPPSEENISSSDNTPAQDHNSASSPGPQSVPQKPIRKSLSLKSLPATVKSPSVTLNAPSMRLQEAIRMKTAAMSSRDGFPTRLNVRSSTSSSNSSIGEPGVQSTMSSEGGDLHKSPASTASFIFSRSTKKVVIETPASPEAQAHLKQSLAAELMQISDQSKAAVVINGNTRVPLRKPGKIPPPVAKKPTQGTTHPSDKPVHSGATGRVEMTREPNGGTETVQPAGQQAPLEDQDIASKTETPNIVETPVPV